MILKNPDFYKISNSSWNILKSDVMICSKKLTIIKIERHKGIEKIANVMKFTWLNIFGMETFRNPFKIDIRFQFEN